MCLSAHDEFHSESECEYAFLPIVYRGLYICPFDTPRPSGAQHGAVHIVGGVRSGRRWGKRWNCEFSNKRPGSSRLTMREGSIVFRAGADAHVACTLFGKHMQVRLCHTFPVRSQFDKFSF